LGVKNPPKQRIDVGFDVGERKAGNALASEELWGPGRVRTWEGENQEQKPREKKKRGNGHSGLQRKKAEKTQHDCMSFGFTGWGGGDGGRRG